ncbi:MAG: hypothetical protein NWE93_13945 [Candidatus Bathyarchaeota archaeon]|nr:hypothetical protein [Candidatus Bathyarchaeota archaeon]
MVNKRSLTFLLLVVAAAGFLYRFALTTMNTYPPGADIGLHESVINSILSPQTSFFHNYYHMGGGVSATNPGYHIFTAFIIALSGAPDYLAQAAVASLFSALMILAAFLLIKTAWGESAGLVAAVLVAFSASDLIMLDWAGYPNIVALTLIPILFYFFLQPTRLALKGTLAAASILASALFLTHLFSAIVFSAITVLTLLLSLIFSRKGLAPKKTLLWLVPIILGALLVAPYLINTLPVYFGSQGAITGSAAVNQQAVVETRVPPVLIVSLAIIPLFLFPVISKLRSGRYFTLPTLLFLSAVLVPLAATQSYLAGVFLDYQRFLYFLALPVMACLALVILWVANNTEKIVNKKIRGLSTGKLKTAATVVLVAVCLLTPLFALPWTPWRQESSGISQANFFQFMTPAKYAAIQWAAANTSEASIFVADANYGWWLSGFAKRPTFSAVDPQYLILQREFEPAQVASNLLQADYLVDNGLLQVEQAGSLANGSTHDIYAILNSSYVHPKVFSLNDTQISLLYRSSGAPSEVKLGDFNQSCTRVIGEGNSASFVITRGNSEFNVTEEITINRGVRFAKVSFIFQSLNDAEFDWLRIPFLARGEVRQCANSIGIVDNSLHQINQIVFPSARLGSDVWLQENSAFYELVYSLQGGCTAEVSFYVGIYPISETQGEDAAILNGLIESYSRTYINNVADLPLTCFDYQVALKKYNISYVALTDLSLLPRFADDPTYSLAFRNSEVAIFKVKTTP